MHVHSIVMVNGAHGGTKLNVQIVAKIYTENALRVQRCETCKREDKV